MDKQTLALALVIAALLNLFELTYMKYTQNTVTMNGLTFAHIGMLTDKDPNTGNTIYIPLYEKR